jgi:AraC family transcriptional regulator
MQTQLDHVLGRNHDLHMRSIRRVIGVLSDRLHVAISNDEMADIACFSPCHFNRLFRRVTGIPPIQYHYALRIARAKELLIETNLRITDICFEVGYNSLGTFITRFKELVGFSPSAFRRLARRVAGASLADIQLPRLSRLDRSSHGVISGAIKGGERGVVFTGLFRRALPEGHPSACALLCNDSAYALPVPEDGVWHILSVAVPWTADAIELLTLKGCARGRSPPIVVAGGRWYGNGEMTLGPPSPVDPPILAALPIQVERPLVHQQGHLLPADAYTR